MSLESTETPTIMRLNNYTSTRQETEVDKSLCSDILPRSNPEETKSVQTIHAQIDLIIIKHLPVEGGGRGMSDHDGYILEFYSSMHRRANMSSPLLYPTSKSKRTKYFQTVAMRSALADGQARQARAEKRKPQTQ